MGERAVPILPSRNLRETLSFYERLGFEMRGAPPERYGYLIVERGALELHFWESSDVDPLTTHASCYLRVRDADELHGRWSGLGLPTGAKTGVCLMPPGDTDYGMRDFGLVDPSGNLLRIGS